MSLLDCAETGAGLGLMCITYGIMSLSHIETHSDFVFYVSFNSISVIARLWKLKGSVQKSAVRS